MLVLCKACPHLFVTPVSDIHIPPLPLMLISQQALAMSQQPSSDQRCAHPIVLHNSHDVCLLLCKQTPIPTRNMLQQHVTGE